MPFFKPIAIVFLILSICLIIFLLCYRPIKRNYMKNNYIKSYGDLIYKIALDNDYYLINELLLKLDDNNSVHIDHILFGEKFIYLIKDRYYDGFIEAKERDKSWVFTSRNRERKFIDNPLINNSIRVKRFASLAGLNESYIYSIVVVNDDCHIEEFAILDSKTRLVKKNQLVRTIQTIESQNILPLNDVQMRLAVKDIARLNKNKKNRT